MSRPSDQLRLGHPLDEVALGHQSGPGFRAVMFLRGCTLFFRGLCTTRCLNPELLSASGGWLYDFSSVARRLDRLAAEYSELEGVTVLGGEPTDQPDALAPALAHARSLGLSTMVYTGSTLEELRGRQNAAVNALLEATDVLVDGRFVDALHQPDLVWRGSSNQRFLLLSARYTAAAFDEALRAQGRCAVLAESSRGVVSSGPQTPADKRRLRVVAADMTARRA